MGTKKKLSMFFAKEYHNQQLILSGVSKFYKCWNCKNFLIEQIESKENYAKYLCKKHKENCNITYPKWQSCDDFEVYCDF